MLARALPGRRRARRRRSLPVRPPRRAPPRRDRPPARRRVSASRAGARRRSAARGRGGSAGSAAAGGPAARGARRRAPRPTPRWSPPATTRRPSASAARFGVAPVFRVTRAIGAPRRVAGERDSVVVPSSSRVFVVAGIARPERFFADVLSAGWDICGRDRVPRSPSRSPRATSRGSPPRREAAGAAIVLTTEKDAVRLAVCDLGELPIASVPLDRRRRAGGRVSSAGCWTGSHAQPSVARSSTISR